MLLFVLPAYANSDCTRLLHFALRWVTVELPPFGHRGLYYSPAGRSLEALVFADPCLLWVLLHHQVRPGSKLAKLNACGFCPFLF